MLSTFAIGTEGFITGSSFPGSGICFLYTDFGVPTYYQIAILGLIALFGMREMLLVSERRDRFSTDSIDMGIYPLMVCFMATFFSIGFNIIISQLSP
jgi:hypothetical protein